ncbi:F-box domain-containing protein [Mycena sanguinolenta]|uniref:F-box domain-containing protein n=1 Tax=Mycena sanguinolenta TaxID=230812 RepID=A0A8H6Z7K6_9AGAR|nr:F-box domain-containing protein [Mycena sanguinolenta]
MLEALPVELILILLRGSSIADILNLSRTSSYFRYISFLNRRLWIDASDSYRIRIPLGETLETTDLTQLPRYAARSTAILNKCCRHLHYNLAISPIRTYEATALYDLPAWNFWSPSKFSQRSFVGHAPPAFMNVLPGGRSFLLGSIGHLGIYDLRGEYGYELKVPACARFNPRPEDLAATVDWDSVDNGVHIGLVVLSKAFNEHHDVTSYLSVFRIKYAHSEKVPSTRRTHIFTLPIDATAVSIKGHLILVRNSTDFLLIDLAINQRGWWHVSDSEITHTTIQSAQRTVSLAVNSYSDNTHTSQTMANPSMELFTHASSPSWTVRHFTPHTTHALSMPKSQPAYLIRSEGTAFCRNLKDYARISSFVVSHDACRR